MGPLAGARDFLDRLRERYQVLILSDTFYEFASPLMRQLGYRRCCATDRDRRRGFVSNYRCA